MMRVVVGHLLGLVPVPVASGPCFSRRASSSLPRRRKLGAKLKPSPPSSSFVQSRPVLDDRSPWMPEPPVPRDTQSFEPESLGKVSAILKEAGFPELTRIQGWEKDSRPMRDLSGILGRHRSAGRLKDEGTLVPLVLESKRLISEAIKLGFSPAKVVTSRLEALRDLPLDQIAVKSDVQLVLAPYKIVSGWSDLTTSTGLLAVFDRNEVIDRANSRKSLMGKSGQNLTVVVDNVRNPDNLGGILRVAAAAGCNRVVTTKGCVDAWNSKVVRAAAGAHFHCPIVPMASWSSGLLGPAKVLILDHCEGDDGLDPSHPGGADLGRSREFQKNLESQRSEATDDLANRIVARHGGAKDRAYEDTEALQKAGQLSLKPVRYSDVHLNPQEDVVVVVGGETCGVSREAHLYGLQNRGSRVFVPLSNQMDSLNVVSVVSIVLFQLRCQLVVPAAQNSSYGSPDPYGGHQDRITPLA